MLRATFRKLSLVALLPLLTQCTGIPDGLEPVRDFNLDAYLGTWFEIARLDHRFERGLTRVSATYSLRDDGGINVVNKGFSVKDGEWQEAVGKAYPNGEAGVGRLKVSFFGPFYGGYNVIALQSASANNAASQCAMVAGPNRSYLWILCRKTQPDKALVEGFVAQADAFGFAVDELIFVSHDSAADAALAPR